MVLSRVFLARGSAPCVSSGANQPAGWSGACTEQVFDMHVLFNCCFIMWTWMHLDLLTCVSFVLQHMLSGPCAAHDHSPSQITTWLKDQCPMHPARHLGRLTNLCARKCKETVTWHADTATLPDHSCMIA